MARGFFGIGVEHGKNVMNVGTLWRSADLFGADFMFTIGKRYKKQASDTMKSWKHIPLWSFDSFEELRAVAPRECLIIGVELVESAVELPAFSHPERALYVLGAEDYGLSKETLARCHHVVRLPGRRSMNVAAAGTVILYDRYAKRL